MASYETNLTKLEKKWILDQRITRLTDDKEVLIYPMGAERYLSLVLSGDKNDRYDLKSDIKDKNILIIPGYGNSAFLFAQAGAKSITIYDKDPVTIAWVKAYKKYYHYREYNAQGLPYPSIGELLTALTCWYPPIIKLPAGTIKHILLWAINPKLLRRAYIFYMLSLVQKAIQSKTEECFELDKDIVFYVGEVEQLITDKDKPVFDTAFVPYLLGVKNGIETTRHITDFIKNMLKIVPEGHILVTPSRNVKEFHFVGQRYFETTEHDSIQTIDGLEGYFLEEDKYWFKTQGLAIFGH